MMNQDPQYTLEVNDSRVINYLNTNQYEDCIRYIEYKFPNLSEYFLILAICHSHLNNHTEAIKYAVQFFSNHSNGQHADIVDKFIFFAINIMFLAASS